ncbi:RsiW-degrading membrane proteinase PrsW (M82 family) [Allocatelliglobosispora scoriae]|uniref:RsiW-degrading membrane proteinase PrsW (M82 family) n=1 Tax=Allocatelliglobosispora scoriae TaxID=643052 RepID=A0A841C492_9ACTN|nr:RsiW-degrading membrane proteinase PrsW (M82 family) [Allocatelliglobosispora scoriae]
MGAVLLLGGFVAAYLSARERAGVPAAGWFPDPASMFLRSRRWDARAWTSQVEPGSAAANRGRHLRGRFLGRWIWILAATLVVLAVGCAVYRTTGNVHVMAVTSGLAMTGVCWAFYRFAARQLALDDAIGITEMIAVATAVAGAVILIAANANSALIDAGGIRLAAGTVGFVEEGTKLLVPLALYALGRYRDPRAGIGLGLAAGFGFAITETTQYAYATAQASGPDFCGTETAAPTVTSVIQAQVMRIFTVSPLHWLWTGIAVAVAWRLWHLYGRQGTTGAVGAIILVMAVHSANDTSATLGCGRPAVSLAFQVLRWAILIGTYLVFRAMARKSTPPQLIGAVSRGWTPHRLRTDE